MEKIRQLTLKENLIAVKSSLKHPTNLVVVSKTYPASDIKLCYELGERDFGENHVMELEEKARELVSTCPEIRFHMIGHLQTNKVKKLLKISNLVAIHSVDSINLVETLIKEESLISSPFLNLFLQVKTTDENEKHGFTDLNQLEIAIKLIQESARLRAFGLMTMGKIRTEDIQGDAVKSFEQLLKIRSKLDNSLKLSMGMSSDYEIASKMGADYVRIGSKIFGAR